MCLASYTFLFLTASRFFFHTNGITNVHDIFSFQYVQLLIVTWGVLVDSSNVKTDYAK